jgi:hypothetical protein
MSQLTALQMLDARILRVFAGAGINDTGTYTAPGGSPIPCRLLVDRNIIEQSDRGTITAHHVQITLFVADVGVPVARAIVTINGTGEIFRLESLQVSDESHSKWIVEK